MNWYTNISKVNEDLKKLSKKNKPTNEKKLENIYAEK